MSESKTMFPTLKVDAFMKKPIAIKKLTELIQTTMKSKN